MTKKAVFLLLLGVLCVTTALAASKRQIQYRLDGTLPQADFDASITGGEVDLWELMPAPLPDGTMGYEVDIYWYNGSDHEIFGLVPASAVSYTGLKGPLQINITRDLFLDVGELYIDDTTFTSLEGTFTIYTDVGSETYISNGKWQDTYKHLDGSTELQIGNGTWTDYSATFEGTLVTTGDTYDLSVQGPYPDADVGYGAGTNQDVIIPAPTAP